MNQSPSVKTFFKRTILKQSAIGFLAMILISVAVTFFLSRYKMSLDLQKSASAVAEAFRSRILEGDIKAVEKQVHDVLGLGVGEKAYVLNPGFLRIYKSPRVEVPQEENLRSPCKPFGETCFSQYFGPGEIFLPIFFDEQKNNIFGYLYVAKSLQFDWLFVILVFAIFAVGYVALLLGLANITKSALGKLATDLEKWALRLKENPKDENPLSEAPFSELGPLKEAIEGLNAQIEEFEGRASRRAKTLLLRGITHDILSPVAQVQYYLATLEKQFPGESAAHELLEEIKSSLKKVSMIASQVKSLNENSGPVPPINLQNTIQNEISFLEKNEDLRTKEITLDFSIHSQTPLLAQVTRIEIGRILQNLVQNAVEASYPRSKITVSLANENGWVTLSVSDSGEGIPAHLQSKIFDPDFTSKPATGTGLGLFVVKHICEQREGFINLDSELHRGTKISVNIPQFCGDIHAI